MKACLHLYISEENYFQHWLCVSPKRQSAFLISSKLSMLQLFSAEAIINPGKQFWSPPTTQFSNTGFLLP